MCLHSYQELSRFKFKDVYHRRMSNFWYKWNKLLHPYYDSTLTFYWSISGSSEMSRSFLWILFGRNAYFVIFCNSVTDMVPSGLWENQKAVEENGQESVTLCVCVWFNINRWGFFQTSQRQRLPIVIRISPLGLWRSDYARWNRGLFHGPSLESLIGRFSFEFRL